MNDLNKKPIFILGISCFYHDAGACLIKDGEIIAAAEEERFTRKKHDSSFPKHAIDFCLRFANIEVSDLSGVGFYDKPFTKFERIVRSYLSAWPFGAKAFAKAVPVWVKEKLFTPQIIRKELKYTGPIYFTTHHMAHAASSYLVSPFEESAILTIDGVGEWATTTYSKGVGNDIEILKELRFPDSLGLLYSAFTYYLGFRVNSAEYKVMGAAPYGTPKYVDLIKEHLIDIKSDGSFKINLDYFSYHFDLKMINKKFEKLFGQPVRTNESKMEQFHFDVAASLQAVTEEAVLNMARHLHAETKLENLCMAGGVALNCVANGRILRELPFKNIFIQPASGDAGGALGVAIYVWNKVLDNPKKPAWKNPYLGPEYTNDEIKQFLDGVGAPYTEHSKEELLSKTASLLQGTNVVGWFQGRAEFGPRALGNRSILADARNKENWKKVNLKIKFRESFRPFAPSVLLERSKDYFDLKVPSPYMLLVAPVIRDDVPAVTHVDKSARIQTVTSEENGLYYDLIKEFDKQTGCAVIINTSFNVRGEPMVLTPEDAFRCFMRTEMDYLVLGNIILDKSRMPEFKDTDWQKEFELD